MLGAGPRTKVLNIRDNRLGHVHSHPDTVLAGDPPDPGGADGEPAAGVHCCTGRPGRPLPERFAGEQGRVDCDEPSSTMPSMATFSPGRTTNTSPTASWSIGMRISVPPAEYGHILAPRSSSARSAEPNRRLARASKVPPGED
jgi:hypothetical protein